MNYLLSWLKALRILPDTEAKEDRPLNDNSTEKIKKHTESSQEENTIFLTLLYEMFDDPLSDLCTSQIEA